MDKNNYVVEKWQDRFKRNDRKIEIPIETVHICDKAFHEHPKVAKITIHPKVKKIGKSVFEGCLKLEKIKLLGESELVVLPERCFKDCVSLKTFEIPSEVGVIKKYAFKGCTSIKKIVIPKHVVSIEVGAFDGWTEEQTIEMFSNFKFGLVCKAKIINHSLDDTEVIEDDIYDTDDGRYMYSVLCKCGHVGRHRYMPIEFPIIASTKKEAAEIGRRLPRVKHDHKDAILEVRQISRREYYQLQQENNNDPYLKIKSKYQQKGIKDLIDTRALPETRSETRF